MRPGALPLSLALLVPGCFPPPPSSGGTTGSTPMPTPMVEEFAQTAHPATDVLLVIDPEPAAPGLAASAAAATTALLDPTAAAPGTSWHVGVLSTALGGDPSPGSIAWFDPATTPDPAPVFDGLAAGEGPFGGIGAVYHALEGAADPAFLQAGAPLNVVVLAGADDATPGLLAEEFAGWLGALGRDVHWSLWAPAGVTAYESVASAFPGTIADPSAVPLEALLGDVGLAASGLDVVFPLSDEPVPGTLEVVVVLDTGVELAFVEGTDWTWDPSANTVTFLAYVPPSGSTVRIGYLPQ